MIKKWTEQKRNTVMKKNKYILPGMGNTKMNDVRLDDIKMSEIRLDDIKISGYTCEDTAQMIEIWNGVVEEGDAFPQEEYLTEESGRLFFDSQSHCGVAKDAEGKIHGMYILHPNNVGRCGHICNASYAVAGASRGLHIGEKLVLDCISQAKRLGFGVLQFNAVVAGNIHARHLYERIGFTQLGTIPGGFRMKDGSYEDICPYYISLRQG